MLCALFTLGSHLKGESVSDRATTEPDTDNQTSHPADLVRGSNLSSLLRPPQRFQEFHDSARRPLRLRMP